MPLIPCRNCKAQISPKAKTCPKCKKSTSKADYTTTSNKKGVLFDNGHLKVTDRMFTTTFHSYQISRIEKTELRSLIYYTAPLAFILTFLLFSFYNILKTHEIFIALILIALCIYGYRISILQVSSKAISEMAAIGFTGELRQVRASLNEAIQKLDKETNEDRKNSISVD